MKQFFILIFILILTPSFFANDGSNKETKSKLELLEEFKNISINKKSEERFTKRQINGIILSAIVPGSGQSYLGNTVKGAAITIGFFGTGVYAMIAHNNMTGREDRIKVLTAEYNSKGTFIEAEAVWKKIEAERILRDEDYKRRQIFTFASLGVWLYNIIDVIFLTSDKGVDSFVFNSNDVKIDLASHGNYNGIALKLFLP